MRLFIYGFSRMIYLFNFSKCYLIVYSSFIMMRLFIYGFSRMIYLFNFSKCYLIVYSCFLMMKLFNYIIYCLSFFEHAAFPLGNNKHPGGL